MVGSDHDQRLVFAGHVHRLSDGFGQLDRLVQRQPRFVPMVSVIDQSALDEQEKAVFFFTQHFDGLFRHLRQRGLEIGVRFQMIRQVFWCEQT